MRRMAVVVVILLVMASLAEAKEGGTDLDSVYLNYLPREGLMPPSRPNFQPEYDDNKDTRTRHNDKSKHELGHAVLKREAEKPKEDPSPVPAKTVHNKEGGDERPRQKKEISHKQREHREQRDLTPGESHLELSLPSFQPGPGVPGKP